MIRYLFVFALLTQVFASSCNKDNECGNPFNPDNYALCMPLEGNEFYYGRARVMKFNGDTLARQAGLHFFEMFYPMDSMGFTFDINGNYEFYLKNNAVIPRGFDSVFVHEKGKMIVDFTDPYEPDCGTIPYVDVSIRYQDDLNSKEYLDEYWFRCHNPHFIFSRKLNETDSLAIEFGPIM